MGNWRQCECVLPLPDGRKHSAIVEASSLFQAALLFRDLCNNGPAEFKRPRIADDTQIEVRPIYKVDMKRALAYANWAESREGRKARSQR
jgi:formylglycine-generating enzyme required for sulfatase activity